VEPANDVPSANTTIAARLNTLAVIFFIFNLLIIVFDFKAKETLMTREFIASPESARYEWV